ncbi:MAG: gcvA 10 [Pseudomonas sp.]|nr:gcvA 10 [Pseudomonas sp.]
MFSKIPLTALRTFEAAARLNSFKLAAEELAVTPAAISHQVKSLEAWLGVLLFERSSNGVRLTDEGERLYRDTHRSLLDICRSLDALRPRIDSHTLTLSTTPALAALWLIPRLGRFHRAWPQFNVRVETSNNLVDLLRDSSVDLAIRGTTRDDPGLSRLELMDEQFRVYGAPGVIEQRLDDGIELISLRWPYSPTLTIDWPTWCAASGHEDWLSRALLREYDDEHYALNAAIAGHGLVLASSVLVADSVASGALVPYRAEISLPGARYVAVWTPGHERRSPVKEFLAWLEQEAAATPKG